MKFIEDYILNKKQKNKEEEILIKAENEILNSLLDFTIRHTKQGKHPRVLEEYLFDASELANIFNIHTDHEDKFLDLLKENVTGPIINGKKYYSLFKFLESIFLLRDITALTYYFYLKKAEIK